MTPELSRRQRLIVCTSAAQRYGVWLMFVRLEMRTELVFTIVRLASDGRRIRSVDWTRRIIKVGFMLI
jgi:hypothetical protein